jgi:hypothetical protein
MFYTFASVVTIRWRMREPRYALIRAMILLLEYPPIKRLGNVYFSIFSVILVILLVVSYTLIGVSFYGIRQAGAGAISIVGLYFSIVGSASTALLIFLGLTPLATYGIGVTGFSTFGLQPILGITAYYAPNFLLTSIGMVILATPSTMNVTANIVTRSATGRPSLSLISGIPSIIGGCFFFSYTIFMLNKA